MELILKVLVLLGIGLSFIIGLIYFIVVMAPFQTTLMSAYTAWGLLGVIVGAYLFVRGVYLVVSNVRVRNNNYR